MLVGNSFWYMQSTQWAQKKYKTLNLKEKLQLINEYKEKNKSELCEKYGVSKATINRILKNKEKILETSKSCKLTVKRQRTGAFEEVESVLSKWFTQMRHSGTIISSQMIMEKAKQFNVKINSEFNPSAGWLYRWQRREGIKLRKIHGEASSANEEGANDYTNDVLPSLISSYKAADIFNADESGLFIRALPKTTWNKEGCQIKGFKTSKDRLTLLFICNATGDYKKVIVIGKQKNPRCFKNKVLPLKYYSQNNAWMNSDIWEKILVALNQEMLNQSRHIIFFVDNASCHKVDLILSNIKMEFLPPNTTSLIQPLDQGIIHSFKSYYRQNIVCNRLHTLRVENLCVIFQNQSAY